MSVLTLDLDNYDAAASELSCTAPAETVFGPDTFLNDDPGMWSAVSNANDVLFDKWHGGFPRPACNLPGDFRLFEAGAASWMELGAPVDLRGYENLSVGFTAGYRDSPNAADELEVLACCGAGCTPTQVATVPNSNGAGQDDCQVYSVNLPAALDDCETAMIRFGWPNSNGAAAVDEVSLQGDVLFLPISETGGGIYTSGVESCFANTFDISCVWNDGSNPPLADTGQVVFQ
jgi:hypothetical protein